MPFSTVQAIENAKHNTDLTRDPPSPKTHSARLREEANLSTLQTELQQALQHEIAMHSSRCTARPKDW